MKKVNVEKILHDIGLLNEKRAENLAKIEADAKEFAAIHNFDEKNTAGFVDYVKESVNFGLSAEDNAKLDILSSYIEEVEEPIDNVSVQEEVTEAIAGDNFNAQTATVNIV